MRIYSRYDNYEEKVRRRLRYFCRNNLTLELAQILLCYFDDEKELFNILCQAYNEYKVSCGREYFCVIGNLDALYKTPEAEEAFIKEIKNYIMDVIAINREEISYGKDTDNRAE